MTYLLCGRIEIVPKLGDLLVTDLLPSQFRVFFNVLQNK